MVHVYVVYLMPAHITATLSMSFYKTSVWQKGEAVHVHESQSKQRMYLFWESTNISGFLIVPDCPTGFKNGSRQELGVAAVVVVVVVW